MKKIFLTGASSGIGRAIAEMLVGQGHEVWGTSRNLERIPKMLGLYPVPSASKRRKDGSKATCSMT